MAESTTNVRARGRVRSEPTRGAKFVTHITLDEEATLKRIAMQRGMTRSALVREIIAGLAQQYPAPPQENGA